MLEKTEKMKKRKRKSIDEVCMLCTLRGYGRSVDGGSFRSVFGK